MGALFVPVYYVLSDVFRRAQLGTPKTQHLAQKSVNYMTVSFSSCNFRIFSSDHGSNENRLVITGILFSLTLSLSKIYFRYLMFVIYHYMRTFCNLIVKLRITILKYQSWYLCQISLQIMLLPILIPSMWIWF